MKHFFALCGIIMLALIFLSTLGAQPAGYAYGKQITIQAAQVGGSLTDFPMLVNVSDSDLRTTTNGGHVENANGYDIRFYADDCTTPLLHQIEKYDAATGTLVAWVRMPSLDNVADTEIRLFYGNSSANTDPSTNSVWSDYGAVWHFSNNSFADASPNCNNGTNNSTTDAVGKVGDCRSFSSSANISVPFNSSLNVTTSFTFQAWINPTALSAGSGVGIFSKNTFLADYIFGFDWPQGGNDALNCWLYNGGYTLYHAGTVQTSQWSHVAATFDGNSVRLYLNGNLIGSTARTTNVATSSIGLVIGQGNSGNFSSFTGRIDEPRISANTKDATWLLTEYNNQNNPSSFYTISAEMTAAEACGIPLPVEWVGFWGNSEGNTAYLTWETASEQDNLGFHIEKSTYGNRFADIGFVEGRGAAHAHSRYAFQDERFDRSAYYRLRQQDTDGASAYSDVLLVRADRGAAWSVFPNPMQDVLWLISDEDQLDGLAFDITNAHGQVVLRGTIQEKDINVAHLPKGAYTLRLHTGGVLEVVSIIKL